MNNQHDNTGFDFSQVGKRMPYTVPEDFFQSMKEKAMDAALESAPQPAAHAPRRATIVRTVIASAAAAVFAALVAMTVVTSAQENMYEVEQAFSHLSAADQEYLIDIYQTDVFIDE